MLQKLNLKNQYILPAGTLLLLLLSYKLAFARTLEAWQIHRDLQQKMQQSGDVRYQPDYLERKNHNLDKILLLYHADTANFRSNILEKISAIAQTENVKLSNVPSKDAADQTATDIEEKLSFEGDYFSLVRTLDKLQSTSGIGVIRSASIRSFKKQPGEERATATMMEIYLSIIRN